LVVVVVVVVVVVIIIIIIIFIFNWRGKSYHPCCTSQFLNPVYHCPLTWCNRPISSPFCLWQFSSLQSLQSWSLLRAKASPVLWTVILKELTFYAYYLSTPQEGTDIVMHIINYLAKENHFCSKFYIALCMHGVLRIF
jgi:hypothetical protein